MATLAGWLRPPPLPSPPGLIGAGNAELDDFADVVGVFPPEVVIDVTTSVAVTELVGVTVTTGVELPGCCGVEVVGGALPGEEVVGSGATEDDVGLGGGGAEKGEEELGGGGGLFEVVDGGDGDEVVEGC